MNGLCSGELMCWGGIDNGIMNPLKGWRCKILRRNAIMVGSKPLQPTQGLNNVIYYFASNLDQQRKVKKC